MYGIEIKKTRMNYNISLKSVHFVDLRCINNHESDTFLL